jgi:hypothetical protein
MTINHKWLISNNKLHQEIKNKIKIKIPSIHLTVIRQSCKNILNRWLFLQDIYLTQALRNILEESVFRITDVIIQQELLMV